MRTEEFLCDDGPIEKREGASTLACSGVISRLASTTPRWQKETKSGKAIIFSSPVLAEDDQNFRRVDEAGAALVQIPSRFRKITIVKGGGRTKTYGFVLDQNLPVVSLEFMVPERWKPFLKPITEIEQLLQGLAQFTWLKQHDQADSDEGVRIGSRLR